MFEMLYALVLLAAEPLPPTRQLSPIEFNDAHVLATIDAAFVAFEAGDGPALLQHVYPEGRVTAMGTLRDGFSGLRSSSFAEYAARMKPGAGFVERITNPVIEIDDDVAMVWAPFIVAIRGKVVSCGTDHFDLVRHDGNWKIMNLTFSSRVTGCPGQ